MLSFLPIEEAEFRLRAFVLGAPLSVLLGAVSLCFNLACYVRLPGHITAYLGFAAVDSCFCLARLGLGFFKDGARMQRAGAAAWLLYSFVTVLMEAVLEAHGVDRAFGDDDPQNLVVISYVVKAFGTGLMHGLQGMSQFLVVTTFAAVVVGLCIMIAIFKRMTLANEGSMIIVPGVLGLATSLLLEQALRKGFEWELCGRAALHERMESLRVEKERLNYERAFAHTALERAQTALESSAKSHGAAPAEAREGQSVNGTASTPASPSLCSGGHPFQCCSQYAAPSSDGSTVVAELTRLDLAARTAATSARKAASARSGVTWVDGISDRA